MQDKSYAFVDRRCPKCNEDGIIYADTWELCPECNGTGLIGSFEEVPGISGKIPSALATRLRLTRERRKMSMSDLAKHFGWSVVHLSDIERGRWNPIDDELRQIEEWIYGKSDGVEKDHEQ